ncbi:FYVE-domain-containing protein [Calocera viscosa TUFC12733]|uniref:FYVE-domain-containing protein n=1 Tax=Calocera viscosa (strain TUFC12733) TaxID=1330018 RepID=A0A167NHD9_CALVF|nr:FYVE-domain-containing protein [Calocera viscosa TUFC12733]
MDSLPITYRPYQSKRHSRSHSSVSGNSGSAASSIRATSPLSQAYPNSDTLSPPLVPERSFSPVFLDEEDEKRLPVPLIVENGIVGAMPIDEKGKAAELSPPAPSSIASDPSPPLPPTNGPPYSVSSTLPSPSDPSTPAPTTPERPNISARPSSTFRHVPLRAKPSHVPSPLRPGPPPVTRSFQVVSTPPPSAGAGRLEPGRAISQPHVQQLRPQPAAAPSAPPPAPAPPPKDLPTQPLPIPFGRSASGTILLSPPSSSAPTTSMVPSPNRTLSPSPAPSLAPTSPVPIPPATAPMSASFQTQQVQHRQTPYRAGFQPKPLYRLRTEEFLEVRNRLSDERKGDDRRLERRLEKLIQLHFAPKKEPSPHPSLSRSTSLLNELKGAAAAEAAEIRAAEQRIAPWEPDSSVSACRLCSTPFNALTVRKHHCRLCGQIICSQPPAPKHSNPARHVPCSVLIAADWRTGRVWDIKEGIAYGVTRRDSTMGANGGKVGNAKAPGGKPEEEKGVRVCRECREKVKRIQYVLEKSRLPPISRLYNVLLQLEKELLDVIPTYQEQMLEIPSPPTAAALAPAQETRKLILDTFADYDKIAGRILSLPCTKGSEEERVQRAIWMRSRAVLQKEMAGLPALPKLPAHRKSKSRGGSLPGSGHDSPVIDPDAELAHRLQPLLEQEALLDQYVAEATAARKFEDARALRQSLEEIREEVGRLVREANS